MAYKLLWLPLQNGKSLLILQPHHATFISFSRMVLTGLKLDPLCELSQKG